MLMPMRMWMWMRMRMLMLMLMLMLILMLFFGDCYGIPGLSRYQQMERCYFLVIVREFPGFPGVLGSDVLG